ncbi:MAG: MFS transporter, partial [Actinomycetota bacterium]|nr:MFS transporter [Actinomycetota bacterium]
MSRGVSPKVGAGWFTLFTLAWLAIWTAQLTPVQLLLPLQLDTPDDASGWIAGVVYSGLVLGIGGIVAIVALPIAGSLSDRTRGRWGRRRPWAVGGSLLAAASLVALA